MPTYTYRCPKCGTKFDLFHSISDDSEKQCPECGEVSERQIGGGVGFTLGGSGGSGYSGPPSGGGHSHGGFS